MYRDKELDDVCEYCGSDKDVVTFTKRYSSIVVCSDCFDVYLEEGLLEGYHRTK